MDIQVNIPNATSSDWAVSTMKVSKKDVTRQMINFFSNGGRYAPKGTYKKLERNGTVVMTNTPDEIRDHLYFIRRAEGSILINGLGLGVAVAALLKKKEVTDITVIENSKDVIKLVADTYLKDKRVTIINADAFEWQPPKGKRYNYVWHDIWDNICSDNLSEMAKLHRKYGRKTDWQDSWCKGECQYQKRRGGYY